MEKNITKATIFSLVRNYALCDYPLTCSQVLALIPTPAEKSHVLDMLNEMVVEGGLIKDDVHDWLTTPDSTHCFHERVRRKDITLHKLNKMRLLIRLMTALPCIKCIVLTGSCALQNARESDDVDVMVITSPQTLFLCRIHTTLLTWLLGLRRRRGRGLAPGLICTNIWVDAAHMVTPPQKRGVYSARELVNAVVLVNKDQVWEKFMNINSWVKNTLPNSPYVAGTVSSDSKGSHGLLNRLNMLFGSLQLWYMKPHVTNEFVSRFQLWLHPQVRS